MSTARSMALAAGLLSLGIARPAAAQARQPWSIQGSGLYTAQDLGPPAGTVGGAGVEAQLRRTFARWSVGGGIQYSTHSSGPDDLKLTGFFLEPRLVLDVGSGSIVPYLAARIAYLHGSFTAGAVNGEGSSGGTAFGAGAGIIYGLTHRVNLDLGGALLRQTLGDITLDDPNRFVVRFPSFFGYVLKGGVSIGL